MRRTSRFVIAPLLVAFALSAVPTSVGAGAQRAPVPVAVKIAVAMPLTAGAVGLGLGAKRAVDLAFDDYADELASAGVSVSVVAGDDQGDPATAVTVARTFMSDPSVLGVVGHLNSGCSIPASRVYHNHHVAMISPMSTNPYLTQQGLNNVFRTCATDAGQGKFVADKVVKNLRLNKACIVDDSTPYGEGLASAFKARFKADGGTVLKSYKTSDKDTDFRALVAKVKAKKPTVIFYGGIYNAGGIFARQLKKKGVEATFVGGDGLQDSEFVRLAGKTQAAGAMASLVGLPIGQQPGGIAFSQRYAEMFPSSKVNFNDAYSYDAAVTFIKALIAVADANGASALSGSNARQLVRDKVAASDFSGVTGPIAFDSVGDTTHPKFSAWRVKSGTWMACADVGQPSVAVTVSLSTTFTVSGSLKPRHAAGTKPVTVRFFRKVGSSWVLGTSVRASVANSGNFSAYSAEVTLAKKGVWRAVATYSDSTHATMDSVACTFTVK